MKKIILAAIAALCVTNIYAIENNDTASSNKTEKKDKIFINKSETAYMTAGPLAIAWNLGLNTPKNIDSSNSHSMHIAWDVVRFNWMVGSKPNDILSFGLGMAWNKYATTTTDGGIYYMADGIAYAGKLDGVHCEYSRYLTYALTIPFMYTHKFSKKFNITAGPVINFNVKGTIYSETHTMNYDKKECTHENKLYKSANQNPVTVDLRLAVNYGDLGFFFKYSPVNVIKTDKGPTFQSIGLGLQLNLDN